MTDIFVLDIGNSNTCWGYAGHEDPRQVITSTFIHETNPANFHQLRENLEPHHLLTQNALPPLLQAFLAPHVTPQSPHTLQSTLNRPTASTLLKYMDSFYGPDLPILKDHQLFVTEPTKAPPKYAQTMAELALEVMEVSSYYSSPKAPLGSIAMARPTSCVLEMGPLGTTVTPVFEGYKLNRNIQEFGVGGLFIDVLMAASAGLYDLKTKKFVDSFNPFRVGSTSRKNGPFTTAQATTTSPACEQVNLHYLHAARLRVVEDLKQSILRVYDARPSLYSQSTRAYYEDAEDLPYELPDRTTIFIPAKTSKGVAEILLTPAESECVLSALKPIHDTDLSPLIKNFAGLPTAVISCAFSCDVQIRPILLQNIVVVGGPAATEGLMERFAGDLPAYQQVEVSYRDRLTHLLTDRVDSEFDPKLLKDVTSLKFKVAAQPRSERQFTTWVGGSILSSLSSFRKLWITKADWLEHGPTILQRRMIV